MRTFFLAIILAPLIVGSSGAQVPPPVDREFRGVGVATVVNIYWPSKPGLTTWDQQRELLAILDRAVALELNAIVFQVRPGADAFYRSPYEPWSEYLTGRQGRPPEPVLYDWWRAQNTLGRHIWPGLATYRVGENSARNIAAQEIVDEIDTIRARGTESGRSLIDSIARKSSSTLAGA